MKKKVIEGWISKEAIKEFGTPWGQIFPNDLIKLINGTGLIRTAECYEGSIPQYDGDIRNDPDMKHIRLTLELIKDAQ